MLKNFLPLIFLFMVVGCAENAKQRESYLAYRDLMQRVNLQRDFEKRKLRPILTFSQWKHAKKMKYEKYDSKYTEKPPKTIEVYQEVEYRKPFYRKPRN